MTASDFLSIQAFVFYALALVTLVAAFMVVRARLITHAALWMALSFTSVAGIFLMEQSEFVAAIQVLIYAGAITTMVIFAIMLSEIRDIKVAGKQSKVRTVVRGSATVAFLVAGLFAAGMIYLYVQAGMKESLDKVIPYSTQALGQELFTTYSIPFEVASILLLVAMVGAIILTAKEDKTP